MFFIGLLNGDHYSATHFASRTARENGRPKLGFGWVWAPTTMAVGQLLEPESVANDLPDRVNQGIVVLTHS